MINMQDAILWVELTLCVVHVVAAGCLFLRRRNTWPIKRRASSVVLLTILAVHITTVEPFLNYWLGGFPCVSTLITHILVANVVINCLLVRAGRVWFQFFFSREKARSGLQRGHTYTCPAGKALCQRKSNDSFRSLSPIRTQDVELSIDGDDRNSEQSKRDETELSRSTQSSIGGVCKPTFGSAAWFARYHHLVTEKNMLIAVFSLASIQLACGPLPAYVIHVQRNNIDILDGPGPYGCTQLNPPSIAFGAIAAITAVFALWTSFRLRRARDNYAILSELKCFAIALVATYGLGGTIGSIYPLPALLHALFGSCQLLTFISLTLPVIRSYSYASQTGVEQGSGDVSSTFVDSSRGGTNAESGETRKPKHSLAASMASSPKAIKRSASFELRLRDVLTQPALSHKFLEFLTQEFAVENLQFLRVVEDFETIADPDKRDRRALEIYYTFLTATGSLQVNVSSQTLGEVSSTFSSCFDPFPLLISPTVRGRRPRICIVNDENLPRTDTDGSGVQKVYLHRRSGVPISTFTRAKRQIARLLEHDSLIRFRNKLRKLGDSFEADFNSTPTEVAGKFYGPYSVRVVLEEQDGEACVAMNSLDNQSALEEGRNVPSASAIVPPLEPTSV